MEMVAVQLANLNLSDRVISPPILTYVIYVAINDDQALKFVMMEFEIMKDVYKIAQGFFQDFIVQGGTQLIETIVQHNVGME